MKSPSSLSRCSLAALAFVALASGLASAAPTAWNVPAGAQGGFTYSGGANATNRFGSGEADPGGAGFYFTPLNFRALADRDMDSDAGSSDTASDTLSAILTARPTQQFSQISASVVGDFLTQGFARADVDATLRITNLDTGAQRSSMLDFGNVFDDGGHAAFAASKAGPFTGLATLALPAGWTNIRLELDANAHADALFGEALAQIKDVEIGVQTSDLGNVSEIPIPAAALVAPVIGVVAWRSRRAVARRGNR